MIFYHFFWYYYNSLTINLKTFPSTNFALPFIFLNFSFCAINSNDWDNIFYIDHRNNEAFLYAHIFSEAASFFISCLLVSYLSYSSLPHLIFCWCLKRQLVLPLFLCFRLLILLVLNQRPILFLLFQLLGLR